MAWHGRPQLAESEMFARTKRLTLRPHWPEDAQAITQAIAHERVVTRLSRVPWPYTQADAAGWLARPRAEGDISLSILAHEGATPRLVGGIGLHPAEDLGGHEIGYWLTPDAWGRGYATEAGHAMLGIARWAIGLKRLNARHFLDNPDSAKVLGKLGFRPVGRGKQFCLARGTDVECATLELTFEGEPSRMPIAA
ncbi:GNAT family N-acetyltransferase [Sphingomonas sp.]|jgi:RimJ/RimL family protein N-acetyltransferase|uniref:GNAT family N-acetyltransferase n=1 Tax=Sphingomonas sp. TaxID=28214 RepID=UPI002E31F11B|nr:GNAT family N-acetyltransferase [Sphingomonas sp.]HEX4695812.1 GNAT family N-acetyltransferase [Sphingomonas sp.]